MRQNSSMLGTLQRYLFGRSVEIPEALWAEELRALPLLHQLDAPVLQRLRALCGRFLAEKTMIGAAGLQLSAPMELHIATQACLPILHLGLRWYRGWRGIVVYPAAFRVRRKVHEESGLVHEIDADLTGEAWKGGPVVLSWEAAAADPLRSSDRPHGPASNVVIHEFAHKLDLLDGDADGTPPFDRRVHGDLDRATWQKVLDDAFERFCAELDLVEGEIAPNVDPDSVDADRYYAHLPLDPYAATDTAEFFAVSSEAYFLRPEQIRAAFPPWYELLHRFYRGGTGT
jgi:Mlc titration factor MtfA (ptsG expression regulator)